MQERDWRNARTALDEAARFRELREPFRTMVKLSDLEPDQPDAEAVIRKRPNGYQPPAPPPADMSVDPVKWRNLDRKTRRALLRHHRKVTR